MKKGVKYPPEPLTGDEVRTLIDAIPKRTTTGKRNRALLAVLYRSGLRISEALALRPSDIDGNTIRVLHGKGDEARTTAIDDETAALLAVWLERRAALANGHQTVFCCHSGKPVNASYVRSWLKRLAMRAGITKRVHAHGLRHSFAMNMAKQGVIVPVISKALGHANVGTTQTYLDHVAACDVVAAIQSTSW